MATFAGLFRRTTRSSKPDECEPLPEPRPLPSLPDFASLGITDSASIARELLQGSSISIYVGEQRQLFTVPFRMMLYKSSNLESHLILGCKSNDYIVTFPNDDPKAFSHLVQWMHTGKVATDSIHRGGPPNAKDLLMTTALLADIYLMADRLGMDAVLYILLEKLEQTFDLWPVGDTGTCLGPQTILHVRYFLPENDEEASKSELWRVLMKEMCRAFTSEVRPDFEAYQACFEISAFKHIVANAMADKIISSIGRDADIAIQDSS